MRTSFRTGAALLALAASTATAAAAPITFSYTGGFQTFTAPTAGLYNILAYGAQGGNLDSYQGGLGACLVPG